MALNSVSPQQQPTATPIETEEEQDANGIKMPQVPVPGANPIDSQAMSTIKSGNQIAQAASQSGSKKSGGGIFGDILGTAAKIIPFFLKQGGYVGYADGGPASNMTYGSKQLLEPPAAPPQTDPNAPNAQNEAAILSGYVLGALHQRDFGGTPETLEQAAAVIGKMLGGNNSQQGFAQGGMAEEEYSMQPMQQQQSVKPPQSANPALKAPQPMQSMQQPQLPAQPTMPKQPIQQQSMQQQQPMQRARPQGYMQPLSMATGGPPLQPGQPFTGEGEVKGPGGPMDDAIPAKLSNGEYVMSAPAVAFFGVEKMDKMNEQGKQGFMQSKMQVQANQEVPPGMPPTGAPEASMMPPQGAGMMPQLPMMQAKGGPAVRRARGSGFMGI